MDSVALSRDYRSMKGALMIKAYEESGMSLREWLQQNNVSKDNVEQHAVGLLNDRLNSRCLVALSC